MLRQDGFRWSCVPKNELPVTPLKAEGCTAAKFARDAMANFPPKTNYNCFVSLVAICQICSGP